jgi:hypothetical protein
MRTFSADNVFETPYQRRKRGFGGSRRCVSSTQLRGSNRAVICYCSVSFGLQEPKIARFFLTLSKSQFRVIQDKIVCSNTAL